MRSAPVFYSFRNELWQEFRADEDPELVTGSKPDLRPGQSAIRPGDAYHRATRDYPFMDMSTGMDAIIEDASIMSEYLQTSEYPSVTLTLTRDLSEVIPVEDAVDLGIEQLRSSTRYQFDFLISSTFGTRNRSVPYHDAATDYRQVELLKRAVPSGGSRHPFECFIEVIKSPEVPQGWYHFATQYGFLEPLAIGLPHSDHEFNDDSTWQLRMVFAADVSRAMFRYRDPRSFRALPVDMGHIDANLAAMAAFVNWHYESYVAIDTSFGTHLGADYEDRVVSFGGAFLEAWE